MSVVVENITKIYGEQKAVDQISFEAKKGEILGLLGPNGAGKTTTMKIITCFLPPTSGSVTVSGLSIFEDDKEVRKRIGYLPEHNPLYLDMYVRESLEMVANIHRVKDKNNRINEVIEMTGLQLEQNKLVGALSKGYRQRVGLAQALIHDPEVLILDEPTSGLDPNQLAEIRNLIKTLGKEKTIIFSSHILQEVNALCDRVVILNRGKLVADNDIQDLTSLQKEALIINVEFLKKVNKVILDQHFSEASITQNSEKHFEIVVPKDKDPREALFDFAVSNNNKLLEIRLKTQSVEKVFQELTQIQD